MSYNLNDREFVVAWMKNKGSVGDLAEKLGTTPATLSSRATYLRKRGVKLPINNNVSNTFSVEALNKLVKKYS